MKKIIVPVLFLFIRVQFSSAQDYVNADKRTFYFDRNDRMVAGPDSAYYFRVIETTVTKIFSTEYYMSGQVRQTSPYLSVSTGHSTGLVEGWHENGKKMFELSINNGQPEGLFQEWYENGNVKSKVNYTNNLLNGEAVWYYPDGKIRRNTTFQQGDAISSQCFSENGTTELCQKPFFKTPSYPGGIKKLLAYLQKNLVYPKKARQTGIQGKVYISFLIDKEGQVRDAFVLKGLSPDLDTEALRVVNAMPGWEPGFSYEEPVNTSYVLPIYFLIQSR